MTKLRLLYASSWSATIAVLFATIITILGELSQPFKDWLKSVTGHHWTTKSWFTVGVYAVFLLIIYALKREPSDTQIKSGLKRLIAVAIIGALALFIFFVWHYLAV